MAPTTTFDDCWSCCSRHSVDEICAVHWDWSRCRYQYIVRLGHHGGMVHSIWHWCIPHSPPIDTVQHTDPWVVPYRYTQSRIGQYPMGHVQSWETIVRHHCVWPLPPTTILDTMPVRERAMVRQSVPVDPTMDLKILRSNQSHIVDDRPFHCDGT